jgi:hypothetical protein
MCERLVYLYDHSLERKVKGWRSIFQAGGCFFDDNKNVSFGEQLQNDYQEICRVLNDNPQGKIARSKHAKRFPFFEHCHLPRNGNTAQKTEAMLSWLQTSGNAKICNNLGMQRMFCKLLYGNVSNPQALVVSRKNKAP